MNPIGMLIVTIGLIVLGIKYLIDHWDLVSAKTAEVVEKIKNFVGGVKDFIVDKFKALGEFIIENHPLLKLFRAIRDYAPTLIDKFKTIGSDLVKGLQDGISDSWNSFKSWLIDKLGDPIKWAKKVLGISSPSKMFAKIGENVVAGYIQGIDSMSSQLQNTVGSMALDSTVAFDGAVAPTSAPAMASSTSSVYNINVNAGMGANGNQIGREIVDAIKRYERTSGPVFASA